MTRNSTETRIKPWSIQLPATSSDAVSMTFCHIPACPNGFLMGSRGVYADEEPIHRVVISEDFWMGETPVTQAQFDCWQGAKARGEDYFNAGLPDHPAERLNWHDAQAYCDWLTNSCRHQFPKGFELASLSCEAQWEYACRGDATGLKVTTDYHNGDGAAALRDAGWFADNSGYKTQAVRQKSPNDFGLFDMHGNVWEWCLDPWDPVAYRRRWDSITERESFVQAESTSKTEYRVLRGGSIRVAADWCRSAFRIGGRAEDRGWDFGFRVCLVRSPLVEPDEASTERKDS